MPAHDEDEADPDLEEIQYDVKHKYCQIDQIAPHDMLLFINMLVTGKRKNVWRLELWNASVPNGDGMDVDVVGNDAKAIRLAAVAAIQFLY